jgi:hypothetical protein
LLFRYADGSPDFRIGVHVLVVVKHMSVAKMFWRTCMKWHYSPDLQAESILIKRAVAQLSKLFLSCFCSGARVPLAGEHRVGAFRGCVPGRYSRSFFSQIVCFLRIRRVGKLGQESPDASSTGAFPGFVRLVLAVHSFPRIRSRTMDTFPIELRHPSDGPAFS